MILEGVIKKQTKKIPEVSITKQMDKSRLMLWIFTSSPRKGARTIEGTNNSNNNNIFICTQCSTFFTFVIFIVLILERVQDI